MLYRNRKLGALKQNVDQSDGCGRLSGLRIAVRRSAEMPHWSRKSGVETTRMPRWTSSFQGLPIDTARHAVVLFQYLVTFYRPALRNSLLLISSRDQAFQDL